MWLLPILIIGAIVIAASSKSAAAQRQPFVLPHPVPMPVPMPLLLQQPSMAPSPLLVLSEFAHAGLPPPPVVILSAIAEAEAMGREDVAESVIRAFVAPVVYQHTAMQPPRIPQARAVQAPVYGRGGSRPIAQQPVALPPPPHLALDAPRSDAQLRAMIHADPEGFMAMLTREVMKRPQPVIEVPVHETAVPPASFVQTQPALPFESPFEAIELPEPAMEQQPALPGSPIEGVSDEAWREFVMRLARESIDFSSARHIGQFRQHRDRLAEIGIDPAAIANNGAAQYAAFEADMADALHHASNGGLLAEHLGRNVIVPGVDEPATVTLSGILGVIQCAGLENATNWLEKSSDRKRFPNTTQAFLRSTGIF